MEAPRLLILFALSMAGLLAWSWWLDRHARRVRRLMRRMGRQYEELAIAVGVELVAVMDSAAAAFREFEESYRRVMVTLYQEDTDG